MSTFQKALHHFKTVDYKIYAALKSVRITDWLNESDNQDHFSSLVSTIIGQQLSGKAAATIQGRVISLLPDNTISAEHILATPDEKLRSAGMSWAKVRSVKDLSQKVIGKVLQLEHLSSVSDDKVIAMLTTVKGIGRWSAEMALIFSLKRPDVFSFGDVGLKNGLKLVYGKDDLSNSQIETITNMWRPYRSYGSIALWHALDSR